MDKMSRRPLNFEDGRSNNLPPNGRAVFFGNADDTKPLDLERWKLMHVRLIADCLDDHFYNQNAGAAVTFSGKVQIVAPGPNKIPKIVITKKTKDGTQTYMKTIHLKWGSV